MCTRKKNTKNLTSILCINGKRIVLSIHACTPYLESSRFFVCLIHILELEQHLSAYPYFFPNFVCRGGPKPIFGNFNM